MCVLWFCFVFVFFLCVFWGVGFCCCCCSCCVVYVCVCFCLCFFFFFFVCVCVCVFFFGGGGLLFFWPPSKVFVSRARCLVVRYFPALHFDVITMSLTSPASFQFCVQVTEEMHVDCDHLCHRLFLSLWNELLITYCSVLMKN